jgi:hypothetical protein
LFIDKHSSKRDLKVTSVAWDTTRGGAKLNYRVSGDIPKGTTVGLYWASGPTAADRIGAPIYEEEAPVPPGDGVIDRSFRVPGSRFLRQPAGATHLVLVADPVDGVPEDSESNNVATEAWAPRVFVEKGTLYVLGSDAPNEARVSLVSGQVYAKVNTLDSDGVNTAPGLTASGSFAPSAVRSVRFEGWGGNDAFYRAKGVTDPTEASGGAGADRILVATTTGLTRDGESADAVVLFKSGDKTYVNREGVQKKASGKAWTDADVLAVDLGFRLLVAETDSTELLKQSTGGDMTFERYARIPGKGAAVEGDNNGTGRVRFSDGAYSSKANAALAAIHELGHNWDATAHGDRWLDASGWVKFNPFELDPPAGTVIDPSTQLETTVIQDGNGNSVIYVHYFKTETPDWWCLADRVGDFAYRYGLSNPDEDWSTEWESYFLNGAKYSALLQRLGGGQMVAPFRK